MDIKSIVWLLAHSTAEHINATVSPRDLRTPLHLACAIGNLAIVQLLLWVKINNYYLWFCHFVNGPFSAPKTESCQYKTSRPWGSYMPDVRQGSRNNGRRHHHQQHDDQNKSLSRRIGAGTGRSFDRSRLYRRCCYVVCGKRRNIATAARHTGTIIRKVAVKCYIKKIINLDTFIHVKKKTIFSFRVSYLTLYTLHFCLINIVFVWL